MAWRQAGAGSRTTAHTQQTVGTLVGVYVVRGTLVCWCVGLFVVPCGRRHTTKKRLERMKHYDDEFIAEDGRTYVERDGEQLLVAKNGALVRRLPNGKTQFVKGSKIATAITSSEMGVEYAKKRAEKRRQIVMEAANEAVERNDWTKKHGDYAFIAAIANTAMIKATTPDDPKAIEAARFVLAQAGLLSDDEEEKDKNASVLEALGREAVLQVLARAKALREAN